MEIIEVRDHKTAKEFLKVPVIIYRDDNNWIRPLDAEIEAIFDPAGNVFFEHGDACRWIMKDKEGKLIGRVAAFFNEKKAYNYDQPTGGMGFFECINDKEAAFKLFDICRYWLKEKGMEAMDGPINFGENDNHWGLLVEGYTPPGHGMNYNMPYYKELFEAYGFKFYFEQVTNHLDLHKKFPERFWKIAEWVMRKPGYTFEHFSFKNAEKYLNDLKIIYDTAWVFHENFTPVQIDDLRRKLNSAKNIIDEEFIWFVYFEGEPIAFLIMFPDINQIVKKFNGKLNMINKLRFLYYKKRNTITRARITIMGVVPKFQKSGVESAIFWHLNKVMQRKKHYKELELSWVGDFNPKMRVLHDSVGGSFAKKHITYRKVFDKNAGPQRSTIIPKDTKEKVVKKSDS